MGHNGPLRLQWANTRWAHNDKKGLERMTIEIKGNWKKGFALDLHTKSSTYLGPDEFGHDQFETTRTELGQHVYDLKYRSDMSVVPKIVDVVLKSIKGINKMDAIIPVPPSKKRTFQPVHVVADALGKKTGVPVIKNEVLKAKATLELKGITDPSEREEVLRNAFSLSGQMDLSNKKVLLVDDLYRSGATMKAITSILYDVGKVKNVYVITLTKTRSKR